MKKSRVITRGKDRKSARGSFTSMLACQENKSLYGHENVDKHNILYVNDSKKSLQLLSLDRHPAPAAKSESVIASISEKRAHICSLSACYNDMRQEVKASRIVSNIKT